MEQKAVIMDENAMRRAVARITYEILERNRGAENLCIVGILSRGVVLAERIARKIYELEQVEVEFGAPRASRRHVPRDWRRGNGD